MASYKGYPFDNFIQESYDEENSGITFSTPTKTDDYRTYLCDYYYKGDKYSVDIPATSFEEAEERRRAIGRGEVVGELMMRVPVGVPNRFVSGFKALLRKALKMFRVLLRFRI